MRGRPAFRKTCAAVVAVAALGWAWVPSTSAQQSPTGVAEPTGRAVCNVASTAAAVLSYANFTVPPDAPLSLDDVVVALTPILEVCVATFPPAPARQCVTAEVVPDIGIPLTPPDPLGILTEQVEAIAETVLDPLGLAVSSPLRSFFADALSCANRQPPAGEEDYELTPPPPPPATQTPTSLAPESDAAREVAAPTRSALVDDAPPPPAGVAPTTVAASPAPDVSLVASIPGPLRGPAVAATVLVVLGLGMVLRRQMAPRRRTDLLDAIQGGR